MEILLIISYIWCIFIIGYVTLSIYKEICQYFNVYSLFDLLNDINNYIRNKVKK